MNPYRTAALRYWTHGWQGPLPVGTKPQQKTSPPAGYTGNDGIWPTEEQLVEWVETRGHVNIALRLPSDVIGIDVDDYDDKPGASTMTTTTERHGLLPRTWVSTSRTGRSGIRWFQLPSPQVLPGKLVHPDDPDLSGVEIIQHTHRYAVVPPSIHPNGNPYQWITPDGELVTDNTLPQPSSFPTIPQQWVDHIRQDCSCWAPYNWQAHQAQVKDPVKDAYSKWRARMTEAYGRHDAALGGVMALTAFKERGWPGAGHYLEQLAADFTASLGDTRSPREAELEWERMVDGAEKKAVTTTIPVWQPHQTNPDIPATPETFDARVDAEIDQLRVRDTARRRFQLEQNPPRPLPEILTLRERLARPHPPVEWRIEGWQPKDTRVLLAAQYKAGKTTLTGNLARSLVDNEPWLGIAPVTPITTGKASIVDFEMSERQIDQWLGDQQITHDDRILVYPLRGKASTFNILDDTTRKEWALRLAGTEYIILDCLRPVLDALGLDEHREAGRFLTAFDALCDEAGIKDGLVVHHMGHTGERSRGDSRLRDWPDVEWRLVRANEEPESTRFISAFGRDVEQTEGQLVYDWTTRHLTYIGGDRRDAEARNALPEIVEILLENDPLSGRAIKELAKGRTEMSKALIERVLKVGERDHVIHVLPGPRGAKLHHHVSQCPSVRECPGSVPGTVGVSVPVSLRTGTHTQAPETLLETHLGAVSVPPEEDPWS